MYEMTREPENPVDCMLVQGAQLMSKFGINVPDGRAAQSISDVVKAADEMKDDKAEVRTPLLHALLCEMLHLAAPSKFLGTLAGVAAWQQRRMRHVPQNTCACSFGQRHLQCHLLLASAQVVLKSQIYAGGRGLGTFQSGLKGGVHICKTSEIEELAKKMLGQTLVTKQTGPAGAALPCDYISNRLRHVSAMARQDGNKDGKQFHSSVMMSLVAAIVGSLHQCQQVCTQAQVRAAVVQASR